MGARVGASDVGVGGGAARRASASDWVRQWQIASSAYRDHGALKRVIDPDPAYGLCDNQGLRGHAHDPEEAMPNPRTRYVGRSAFRERLSRLAA